MTDSKMFVEIEKMDAMYENNICALREMYFCDNRGYPNITIRDVDIYNKIWEEEVEATRPLYTEMSDEEFDDFVHNDDTPAVDSTDFLFTEYLKKVEMTYND